MAASSPSLQGDVGATYKCKKAFSQVVVGDLAKLVGFNGNSEPRLLYVTGTRNGSEHAATASHFSEHFELAEGVGENWTVAKAFGDEVVQGDVVVVPGTAPVVVQGDVGMVQGEAPVVVQGKVVQAQNSRGA